MFDEMYDKLITEVSLNEEGGQRFTPGFLRALRNLTAKMQDPATSHYAIKKICKGCGVAVPKYPKGGRYPKLCPYCGNEFDERDLETKLPEFSRKEDFDPSNAGDAYDDKEGYKEVVGGPAKGKK